MKDHLQVTVRDEASLRIPWHLWDLLVQWLPAETCVELLRQQVK